MKKILGIAVICLFAAIGSAQANCGKCGMGDAHKADAGAMASEKAASMAKELNLTDDQKSKLEAIISEKLAKKQAIMDDKQKAMDALHEDFKAKLKTVLNEEQLKNWEANKEKSDGMHGKCPMCKDGKMCKMCKLHKKDHKGEGENDGHDHKK